MRQFGKHINRKKLNIDQINLKDFDAKLLKFDKKDYKEIEIYYIGYVNVKKLLISTILTV